MQEDEAVARKVLRVKASGWLTATDLALHMGCSKSQAYKYIKLPSFPKPSRPRGGWKEGRWEKNAVDEWLRVHQN